MEDKALTAKMGSKIFLRKSLCSRGDEHHQIVKVIEIGLRASII